MKIVKQHQEKFPVLVLNISGFTVESFILDKTKNGEEIEMIEKENFLPNNLEFAANLEKRLEKIIKKTIHEATLFTAKKQKNNIKSCLLSLSSPWYTSFSKTLKIKKETPFLFNEDLIKTVLQDKNNPFLEKIKDDKIKTVEAEIMKIKLNGYETKNPFDKKIKTAEMYFYISAIKNSFLDFINNILKTELHLDAEKFLIVKTLPSLLFNFVKNKSAVFSSRFAENEKLSDESFDGNGLFLFFGNEVAELIIIQENYIKETISINKGHNFFIRGIMETGASFHEADSLFLKYQTDDLENAQKEKMEKIIKTYKEEWKKSWNELLMHLSNNYFLPKNLYLFSLKPVSKNIFLSDKLNFVLKTDFSEHLKNLANKHSKLFDEISSYLIIEHIKNNLV